jgi:hypothetical protein
VCWLRKTGIRAQPMDAFHAISAEPSKPIIKEGEIVWNNSNLPVGMQIIGKRYGDADVLTASGVLERVRPWQHHYSICAQRKL